MKTSLVEAGDAEFAWLIEGTPESRRDLRLPPGGVDERHVLEHIRAIAAALRAHGRAGAWMIVSAGEVIGLCGYKQPPSEQGEVEIGYNIAPSHRNDGHATRAIAALIALGRSDSLVRAIVAKTAVENTASQRVLERNGFERLGTGPDPEDGAPVVFWRLTEGLQ